MSANNIVVIKKEVDGKFRGYHRDYDAYCEGQYDYDGPCQFCMDGCEMCDYTKHYTSSEETPIFEVDTIEGAIHAYHKWLEEMNDNDDGFPFYCEYGYEFQDLEPNAETVEAVKESDLTLIKDNLKFILDRIVSTSNKGEVLVNDLTPEMIKEKVGSAFDLLNNSLQGVREFESVEELMKELDTDNLEDLVKECNRLKKILHNVREGMSNLDYILLSDTIRTENVKTGDKIVIETPDDIRRILKAKIEKIEGWIKQLVNNEKPT